MFCFRVDEKKEYSPQVFRSVYLMVGNWVNLLDSLLAVQFQLAQQAVGFFSNLMAGLRVGWTACLML